MHELSLMVAVRDQALAVARDQGVARIKAISLRIGELAGVEVEALRLAFPVVMQSTIAAEAALCIEIEPAECQCIPCAAPFQVRHGDCECPRCGAISHQLLRGRALQLVALEVE